MQRILVVYGTTDGHTARVARELGLTLRDLGGDPRIIRASREAPGPEGFDGVIIAASLHGGRFQGSVQRWIRRHAAILQQKPAAFIAVCLAVRDSSDQARAGLSATIRRFLDECGWQPLAIKAVAGALLYTKYHWLKRWLTKRLVAKTGGDTDTRRDYIYTDWDDLRRFADDYWKSVLINTEPDLKVSA